MKKLILIFVCCLPFLGQAQSDSAEAEKPVVKLSSVKFGGGCIAIKNYQNIIHIGGVANFVLGYQYKNLIIEAGLGIEGKDKYMNPGPSGLKSLVVHLAPGIKSTGEKFRIAVQPRLVFRWSKHVFDPDFSKPGDYFDYAYTFGIGGEVNFSFKLGKAPVWIEISGFSDWNNGGLYYRKTNQQYTETSYNYWGQPYASRTFMVSTSYRLNPAQSDFRVSKFVHGILLRLSYEFFKGK